MSSITTKIVAALAVVLFIAGGPAMAAAVPMADHQTGLENVVSAIPAGPGIVVAAADEDPTQGHHYDPAEFERQKAILAPKEGDYTRYYVLGAVGLVLVFLLTMFAINRKKWQGPAA